MITYDQAAADRTDRAYLTPDVTRQRMRTLRALRLNAGEAVLDVGCGTGLLTRDMATLVGAGGRVVGIDVSRDMLKFAQGRCADLPQVTLRRGNAMPLDESDETFDAVTCIQVLLYLADVPAAIAEMARVLRPGGRIAIIETDWRGTVLNSFDDALTRRILAAWDQAVPNPNLPARLAPMLAAAGFGATGVEALPVVNTSNTPGNFSCGLFVQFADLAQAQGAASAAETEAWLADLDRRGAEGGYFFCVNRFQFTAVKLAGKTA